MKPFIGITCCSRETHDDGAPVIGARETFVAAIQKAGGIPILLPLVVGEEAQRALFQSVDAILIPGGEDVDPALYGEARSPKVEPPAVLRDEFEIRCARWGFHDGKPVLGVCRGMQLMNVSVGGTLIQDLIDDRGPSGGLHRSSGEHRYREPAHDLILEPGSQIARILGVESCPVSSFHHQAVKDLGAGLCAVGRAGDGIIEAFERGDGESFFVGVQSHPEEMVKSVFGAIWMRMFAALVSAAAAAKRQTVANADRVIESRRQGRS